MDVYEATNTVLSRIKNLDPENASKIMGYILIQDQGEKEMIRLALGPEALLLSYINQAKACLGLSSNGSSAKPSNPPLSNSVRPSNPFPPRILIPNNGFHLSNPSSPAAVFPRNSPRPVSYAAVVNGGSSAGSSSNSGGGNNGFETLSLQFYGGNSDFGGDQLPFVDDSVMDPMMSPSGRSDSLVFPYGEDAASALPSPHPHPFHRRSSSVNDAVFLSNLEEGGGGNGLGWRPCMYYARGFCKNGGFDELWRMKALEQQQRFAAMAAGGHHHFPYSSNKCVNILNDNQRLAESVMLNEFDIFNRCGPRNGLSPMGLGAGLSSSSRQIYLTFPADSRFKEDDVSSYFSMFGPVQDVRIPYQTKRMFGFVTFVYPETVELILAKGNPHFVCDSRVLVKPYKDKGKVPEKKQLQQQHEHLERGEYSTCLSPSGVDSRELFDAPIGSRMLFNTQELMLRRKLEQEEELRRAIEFQGRRMTNLQLLDMKNQQHSHRFRPSLFTGLPIPSPRQSQLLMSQNVIDSSDASNQDVSQDFDNGQLALKSPAFAEVTGFSENNNIFSGNRHGHVNDDDSYLPESLEHALPDNLFASPTKFAAENQSIFSHASAEADNSIPETNTSSNNPPSSSSQMTSISKNEKQKKKKLKAGKFL
ncbi:hypothetical protein DH2020_020883 [Rehmannia glutinosa]|uniref:RRM domain-containing protein n=1 Tax=Rehmannia glutinosa TaxID=99300 RepID=A0ABR0WB28_REHGL